MGFTGSNPHNPSFRLTELDYIRWVEGDQALLCISGDQSTFNGDHLCRLGFDTEDLTASRWVYFSLKSKISTGLWVANKHKGFAHAAQLSSGQTNVGSGGFVWKM